MTLHSRLLEVPCLALRDWSVVVSSTCTFAPYKDDFDTVAVAAVLVNSLIYSKKPDIANIRVDSIASIRLVLALYNWHEESVMKFLVKLFFIWLLLWDAINK
jgi:hypothetical protein